MITENKGINGFLTIIRLTSSSRDKRRTTPSPLSSMDIQRGVIDRDAGPVCMCVNPYEFCSLIDPHLIYVCSSPL